MGDFSYDNWYPSQLLIMHIIAVFLLGSWAWYPTQYHWNMLDGSAFQYLNSLIANSLFWQWFWAIISSSWFDIVIAVIMLVPALIPFATKYPMNFSKKISYMIFCVCLSLVLAIAFNWVLQIPRMSPALTYQSTNLLQQLVPTITSQDYFIHSFPDDRASALYAWLGYLFIFYRNPWRLYGLVLVVIISLAHLVSGAHWLTDNVVGGVSCALISLAWILYSPFGLAFERLLSPVFHKIQVNN